GATEVLGGAGNDVITISGLCATATGSGAVTVDAGAGNDTINVSNLNLGAIANSSLTLKGGLGNDRLSISAASADSLFADLGDGNDTIAFNGALAFADNLQVLGGAGTDGLAVKAAIMAVGNAIA